MATGHRDISAGYIGNPLIHTYNYSFSVCKVHQNRQWYIFLYVCSMSLKIASFTLWLSENSWYTGVIYENVCYVRTCLLYRWIKGTCIGLVSINIIQNKSQGGGGGCPSEVGGAYQCHLPIVLWKPLWLQQRLLWAGLWCTPGSRVLDTIAGVWRGGLAMSIYLLTKVDILIQ